MNQEMEDYLKRDRMRARRKRTHKVRVYRPTWLWCCKPVASGMDVTSNWPEVSCKKCLQYRPKNAGECAKNDD